MAARWSLPVLLAAVVACRHDPFSTGVMVTIGNGSGAPPPDALALTWFDGQTRRQLLSRAVSIPNPQADPLAVVLIQTPPGSTGTRIAVVRGMAGGRDVSEGVGRVVLSGAGVDELGVTLRPGSLDDSDGDGIPDAVETPIAHDAGSTPEDRPPSATDVRTSGSPDGPPRDERAPGAEAGRDVVTVPMDTRPPPPAAVLVIGNPGVLDAGDKLMHARLEGLGFMVKLVKDSDVGAGEANGSDLIVVSSSSVTTELGSRLRDAKAPVVCMEGATFSFMGMTKDQTTASYGLTLAQTTITITNPTHALAAKLTGTATISTMPVSLAWAVVRSNAIVVGSVAGTPSHVAVFGYETGAQLATRAAPARRVGWLGGDSTQFNSLNNTAWTMFDAAVRWASGK